VKYPKKIERIPINLCPQVTRDIAPLWIELVLAWPKQLRIYFKKWMVLNLSTESDTEKSETELQTKSKQRIIRCWEFLCESKLVPASVHNVDGFQYFLDPVQLAETAIQYSSDCKILKVRYGEHENKIQPPKIAGLMASSINRYRPITIREGFATTKRPPLNELLAIFNGIFICSEFPAKDKGRALKDFTKDEFFTKWLKDFVHILRYRNYTSESLVMIYETFCVFYCKEALRDPPPC